jgi:hypothetical protein
VRSIVDPNASPLRLKPREPRDVFIAANCGLVVAYNNLSSLPEWLSDTLCVVSEGSGESRRELYTDAEESLLYARAPFLLTGIENVVVRGDLAQRTLFIHLASVPNADRLTEVEFKSRFKRVHADVLGALCGAVSMGLKREKTLKLPALPRMATFFHWVSSCEPALWEAGTFEDMLGLPSEVFAALKADIAKRGIVTPIDVDEEGNILDGHNRWRAHCESGRNEAPPVIVRAGLSEAEKIAFARRQNILRRHMSREEIRRVIEGQLRDTPDRSDRSIATDLGVDHKTVAAVRRAARGEIPHPAERQGRDGKSYRTPERAPRGRRNAMSDTPEDFVKAMLGRAEAIHANADRIAALPDAVKLAMFNAGLSGSSTVVFRGNAFGHPPLQPHEEKAWSGYGDCLQTRLSMSAEDVGGHIDWLTDHKNFRTPEEWLGEEGREYRTKQGLPKPSADFLAGWRRHSGHATHDEPDRPS